MKNKLKPRKRDNKFTLDITLRDGNTPIIDIKDKKFSEKELSALEEVLETLKRKL